VLASANGKYGLVSIGENSKDQFRYLRAGHSIIGGLWIADKAVLPVDDMNPPSLLSPVQLGDSVYGAFNLQEGVRLFERPQQEEGHPERNQERALVIGLGAGIIPRAMNEHNLSVTIVELDPLVYKYAREYFGLHRLQLRVMPPESVPSFPDNPDLSSDEDGEVYLEEARQWVQKRSRMLAEGRPVEVGDKRFEKYDYIIHDVFSGGSVAIDLFTLEFWTELQSLLRDNGILAVNFAGRLGTPASRGIFLSLQKSFPDGECKAYHDSLEIDSWDSKSEDHGFFNMVFFCARFPLSTRKAVEADYLGSPLREHILERFTEREITQDLILGDLKVTDDSSLEAEKEKWLIKDGMNRLGQWQTATALEHWKLMREVLPHQAWELY